MIIEAQDGRYYIDPVLQSEHALLEVQDECELRLLVREGTSIRKACKELGINIKRPGTVTPIFAIWPTGVQLQVWEISDVQLKEPIPVPTKHQGSSAIPWTTGNTLYWSMLFKVEMILKIMDNPETAIKPDQGCKAVYDFLQATPKTVRRKLIAQIGDLRKPEVELKYDDSNQTHCYIRLKRKDALYVF